MGLRLRGAVIQQYSPDPEYREKLERLLACLQEAAQHPGEVVVVFLDEMGFTRWPEAARDWIAKAPVPPPVARRAGKNNQQWRIIAALNALSGQVNHLNGYIVGVPS